MPVTRELQVTYGAQVVGAGTAYIIDGPFEQAKDYDRVRVAFDLIVTGTSEANFDTECDLIEAAFRKPRQRLIVKFGATVHNDYDPAATLNTGFNATPSITKPGSPDDSGRSRRYRVEINLEVPADLAGQAGRRTSTVTLTRTEAKRKRLFFSGTYTALGANSARAQYDASVNAFVQTHLTAHGGTWEGPHEQIASEDDTNKNVNFSETWEELIYNQSAGTLDDATLRRTRLNITRLVEAPGDSYLKIGAGGGGTTGGGEQTALRLETVSVDYECAVDHTVSKDLKSIYETKVKPFLVETVRALYASGAAALVSQAPRIDTYENRIAVQMVVMVVGNSTLIFCQARTDDSEDAGKDIVPVWGGDRLMKHVFQGPATVTRTVTVVRRDLVANAGGDVTRVLKGGGIGGGGGGGGSDPFGIFGLNKPLSFEFGGGDAGGDTDNAAVTEQVAGKPIGGGPGVPDPSTSPDGGALTKHFLGRSTAVTPLVMGRPGEQQMRILDSTTVERWEYVVRPPGGSGTTRTPTGGKNVSGGTTFDKGGGSAVVNPPGTAK